MSSDVPQTSKREPGFYPVRWKNGWDPTLAEWDGLHWFMAGFEHVVHEHAMAWIGPKIVVSYV